MKLSCMSLQLTRVRYCNLSLSCRQSPRTLHCLAGGRCSEYLEKLHGSTTTYSPFGQTGKARTTVEKFSCCRRIVFMPIDARFTLNWTESRRPRQVNPNPLHRYPAATRDGPPWRPWERRWSTQQAISTVEICSEIRPRI